ncbi:unnamed protein product, partial [Coregonus sp. 'balchen']
MVVKPGESLSVTCKVSGYSISDDSYTTDWIRYPVGKAMEWIVDSDGNSKDSFKSRLSISKDGSNNIVTLEGQRSQTEDTTVYYCVRHNYTQWCEEKHDLYKNNKNVCMVLLTQNSAAKLNGCKAKIIFEHHL